MKGMFWLVHHFTSRYNGPDHSAIVCCTSLPPLGPSLQLDTLPDECASVSGSSEDIGLDDHFPSNFEDSGPSSHGSVGLPTDNIDDLWSGTGIHLDDLRTSAAFVRELQQATLGDPTQGLSCEGVKRLCKPLHRQPSNSVDEDAHLAIDLYLGTLSETRKDRTPRQEFHTIPIELQIQALYRALETAMHVHYLHEE